MKTDYATMSSRIAEITGLAKADILLFLTRRVFIPPTTAEEAWKIINSDHSTPEEKGRALEIKHELSKLEIEQAKDLHEAQKAYYNTSTQSELIIFALEKIISKAKRYSDITQYANGALAMPDEIRKKHDTKVRLALIELATNLDISIAIWKAFPFAGTDEEKDFVAKTREYFTDMTQNPDVKKVKALEVYNKTPSNHPLAKLTLNFALSFMTNEIELKTLYENLNQQYHRSEIALRDADCNTDKINRRNARDFYQEAVFLVRDRLDSICVEKISNETTEDELVEIIRGSRNPDLIATRDKANGNLHKIWSNKLNNYCLTFNEALETFQKTLKLDQKIYSGKFWKAVNEKANSKTQAKKMLVAVRNTEYQHGAVRSWLIYDPDFNELSSEYKSAENKASVASYSELILTALLKKVNTFERADQVLDLCAGKFISHRQQVVLHLATVIKNLNQGIKTLKKIRGNSMDDMRLAVLKSTLKFVLQPLELEFVTTCLNNDSGIRDEEKRLLIEKALELLGETTPAEPTISSST